MSVVEGSECPDAEKGATHQQETVRVEEDRNQLNSYPRATIDALPDDVLLDIFSFDLDEVFDQDRWHTLVHICQRWRYLVFASPRRLNLQLLCRPGRSVEKMLDIWPKLPIDVKVVDRTLQGSGSADIIAALKQHDRVSRIYLSYDRKRIPPFNYLMTMKEPFPVLTDLILLSNFPWGPVIPESFLYGSAPHLQALFLKSIPFPALGKLLSTTPNLVHLDLLDIPRSGYISPDAMVACLSTLTRLQGLTLEFRSSRFYIGRASRPSPVKRVVLPALTSLEFQGHSEYLEDMVSQIDVPLLDDIYITFLDKLEFLPPLLRHFFSCIEAFKALREADIRFGDKNESVSFEQTKTDGVKWAGELTLCLSCKPPDQHPSSLIQVLGPDFPLFSTLEHLSICEGRTHPQDHMDSEYTQLRELLYLFTSVKDLELGGDLVQVITGLLAEVTGERVIEVLPALQGIFVDLEELPSPGLFQPVERFVAARQLFDRPVVVRNRKHKRFPHS